MSLRLLYWRHPSWNFGDELNPWLWERALPVRFSLDVDSWLFLGIGTILHLPRMYPKVAVFGSGLGYGSVSSEGIAHARRHWRFYCVRGPLTASALQIEAARAITDPAVLVPRYFQAPLLAHGAGKSVIVIPHWVTASTQPFNAKLRAACGAIGHRLVDPRQSVDDVLGAVVGARLVLAESLHGAIVADAFRVPWIPLVTTHNQDTSVFKWRDWCASMEVPYEPMSLDLTASESAIGELLDRVGAGFLSRPDVLSARIAALDAAIGRFVADYEAGVYE